MPFTIPEIYVGEVTSGDAVLAGGLIQMPPRPTAPYNPLLQPQQRSKPTSFKEVCQNDMHNGVPVQECFLEPVYE